MNMEDQDRVVVKQPPTIKEKLSNTMFDKDNPEMITYLFDNEIEELVALETIIKEENRLREDLGVETNIFTDFINSLKVHRTSRNGWRATQGESIIKSNIESDEKNVNGLFSGMKNSLFNR